MGAAAASERTCCRGLILCCARGLVRGIIICYQPSNSVAILLAEHSNPFQVGRLLHGDIADRVKGIVVEHLGVEESKVVEGASFIDDLGADSLDTVELVMAFEEEFGCEIPDDAAEKIQTVKDAVDFIAANGS